MDQYTNRKIPITLKIVIFAAGTGNPLFTTDTAAALRAVELNCNVIMKGTLVDGVYDSDPKENPSAIRYNKLSYNEVLEKKLNIMDTAAIALAQENEIPIIIFSILKPNELIKIIDGSGFFTEVSSN